MAQYETNLDIEGYIEEYVELNAETLLNVLNSCWNGDKLRDLSMVAEDQDMVMC